MRVADIELLPDLPGVYKFFDKNKNLLYIGKATSLKARVKSYFTSSKQTRRINRHVSQITFIEYLITADEPSARKLENNLILLLKPQFNIQIKEETNLAIILLTKHCYPQIKLGKITPQVSNYYGPFPSKNFALNKLWIIQKLFKLRTCDDKEFSNRSSPCLLYQLKQCSAPCVGKISLLNYHQNLNQAISLLQGNYTNLLKILVPQMKQAAQENEFELAASYRDIIQLIKCFKQQRVIPTTSRSKNSDLIFCQLNHERIFIYIMLIRNGIYVADNHFVINASTNKQLALMTFLNNRYTTFRNVECVYINEEISLNYKQAFAEMFNFKLLVNNQASHTRVGQLMEQAHQNLNRIILNYNYSNLYLGGINELKSMFNLVLINNIQYFELRQNVVIAVSWNEKTLTKKNKQINLKGEIYIALKDYLTTLINNQAPQIIIIKPLDYENVAIAAFRELKFKLKLLLIKPLPHAQQVIINLTDAYSYTSQNIISNKNIIKLVNLLQSQATVSAY
jgi:excinuclease UvrABC nuclease subunit